MGHQSPNLNIITPKTYPKPERFHVMISHIPQTPAVKKALNYGDTLKASYVGYITQAIVNNLAPLLFLTFQDAYGISFRQITALITVNFTVQLIVDLFSAAAVDRIGYQRSVVFAHIISAAGISAMAVFPGFWGLFGAAVLYGVGGGLIEVLISPIVEACPVGGKTASMSLLHSFYCWGYVLVVIGTTVFFGLAGKENWRILCMLWALIPAWNGWRFLHVPVRSLKEERDAEPVRAWIKGRMFWVFALLMMCSGAAEQAMSQWASAFGEMGLGVSKAAGDMAGPCLFAALMGSSRLFYAGFGGKIPLKRFMLWGGISCLFSYGLAAFAHSPALALAGCALCGLSVGILWPGTYSLAAEELKGGGTAMYAFLALAGDLGCTMGPGIVGMGAQQWGDIQKGMAAAIVFPVALVAGVMMVNGLVRGKRGDKCKRKF